MTSYVDLPILDSEKTDKNVIVINGEIKTIMDKNMETIYTNYNYDKNDPHTTDIFYKKDKISAAELEKLKDYVNILGEKTSYIIKGKLTTGGEELLGDQPKIITNKSALTHIQFSLILAFIIAVIMVIIFIVVIYKMNKKIQSANLK